MGQARVYPEGAAPGGLPRRYGHDGQRQLESDRRATGIQRPGPDFFVNNRPRVAWTLKASGQRVNF